jgi:hypothetical protein
VVKHNNVALSSWLPDVPGPDLCHARDSTSFTFVRVPDFERLELVEQDSTDVPKIAPALGCHVLRALNRVLGSRQELHGKLNCVTRFDKNARSRWKTKQ